MPEHSLKLILASRSPRRRQLLTEAGYRFEVHPPAENADPAPADFNALHWNDLKAVAITHNAIICHRFFPLSRG